MADFDLVRFVSGRVRRSSSFRIRLSCVRVLAIWKDPRVLPCARAARRQGDGLRLRRRIPSTGSGSGICDWLFSARFRGRRLGSGRRLRRRRAGRRLLLRGGRLRTRNAALSRVGAPDAEAGTVRMPCPYQHISRGGFQRRDDFALFFFQLFKDAIEIVPVEADVGCSARQLVSFEDSWEAARNAV